MQRSDSLIVVAIVLMAASVAVAAKRAGPPEWPQDVLDAFFDDARDKLDGPRPDYTRAAPADANPLQPAAAANELPAVAWSKLVEPTTLETEIKRLSTSLDAAIATSGKFKAGGDKTAHRDFGELAVLFAVIGQYDGRVRWQDVAAGLRGPFAQAGFDCRAATDAAYRVAVDRARDLAMLIRGERPETSQAPADVEDWSQLASRPALMQRINMAHEERLRPWLADATAFRRNRDGIRHEAQIVAVLADVFHREAFEFWNDETFVDYARELRTAATAASDAAAADDFDAARAAVSRASAACNDCHAGYRG